jgi:hypothetical protein
MGILLSLVELSGNACATIRTDFYAKPEKAQKPMKKQKAA